MHTDVISVQNSEAVPISSESNPIAHPVPGKLSCILSTLANCTILYQNGSFILVTFGLLVSSGAVLWMLVTGACFLAHGLTLHQSAVFLVGATVSSLLFSHVFWWLGHLPTIIRQPLLGLRNVGFVSWGGLAGIAIFCFGFSITNRYPLFTVSDDVARGLFAAYALGRLGCLTYGCCYGVTCVKRGIRYRNRHAKVVREKGETSILRYPTQIYSCIEGAVLFCFLNAVPWYEVPAGLITALSFLTYPIGRAYIESFRDRKRYVRSLFTSGHFACMAMFILGWLILCYAVHPSNHALPPKPFSANGFGQALPLVPAMLFSGAVVFLATGFHWKRVGTW
jgi:phosphatidylglycerol---prolipoprotein diacylglyceryl transferase